MFLRRFSVVLAIVSGIPALAEMSGLFAGLSGGVALSEATYSKDIDNTSPSNMTSVSGMRFSTSNSGDGNLGNLGAIVGYRMPLESSFLSFQLEASIGAGRVSGFVRGDGESSSRSQFGEAWPESFEVNSNSEIGVFLKWGREMQSSNWTAINGYYLLLGAKQAELELETRYEMGCFTPSPCSEAQFQSGTFEYTAKGQSFVFGGGLEHHFSENLSGQLEIRFESAIEDEWEDLYDNDTIRVLPKLEAQDIRVAFNLVRHF